MLSLMSYKLKWKYKVFTFFFTGRLKECNGTIYKLQLCIIHFDCCKKVTTLLRNNFRTIVIKAKTFWSRYIAALYRKWSRAQALLSLSLKKLQAWENMQNSYFTTQRGKQRKKTASKKFHKPVFLPSLQKPPPPPQISSKTQYATCRTT